MKPYRRSLLNLFTLPLGIPSDPGLKEFDAGADLGRAAAKGLDLSKLLRAHPKGNGLLLKLP